MGITLDAEERMKLLGTHGEGILATTTAQGRAIPLPVWYVMIDGRPCIRTPATSKRVGHIKRDLRVSFLVHAGEPWRELRGVLITGSAEIVEDDGEARRISDILDERFAGLLPPPLPNAVAGKYAETVVLRIHATSEPMSWDNRKVRM